MTGIGNRLRLARINAGLTTREAGERVGVSGAMVTYWEQEARVLPDDRLVDFAKVYKTSVKALAGDQANLSAKTRRTVKYVLGLDDGEYNDFVDAIWGVRPWGTDA